MWLLTIENLHPAFQKNAGRKSPTELGMCQGRQGCARADAVPACITVVVPMTLTMFVRQQDRRANLQWVEKWFNGQETDSAIRDAFLGFCLSTSVIVLINCQFHLPGQRWRKMIALFFFFFFTNTGRPTVGRSPHNSLALPHCSNRLHTSCAF